MSSYFLRPFAPGRDFGAADDEDAAVCSVKFSKALMGREHLTAQIFDACPFPVLLVLKGKHFSLIAAFLRLLRLPVAAGDASRNDRRRGSP